MNIIYLNYIHITRIPITGLHGKEKRIHSVPCTNITELDLTREIV